MKEDSRQSIRVRCSTGLATLRTHGSGTIPCKLLNLSEGGCCLGIEAKDAVVWNRINRPNMLLELLLSSPPHLESFVVTAEIRNVRETGIHGLELGLQFRSMEPKRFGVVRLALLKLASQRLRNNSADTSAAAKAVATLEMKRKFEKPTAPFRPTARNTTVTIPEFAPGMVVKNAPITSTKRDLALGSASRKYWEDPYLGKRIGEVFVRMGKLTQTQVDNAVEESRNSRERFGQYLVKRGIVSAAELCRALALASGLPATDLREAEIKDTCRDIFPLDVMKRYEFVPFDACDKIVCIAASSPFPEQALKEIAKLTHRRIEVFLAEEDLVLQLLNAPPEDAGSADKARTNRRFPRFNLPLPAAYYFCTSQGEPLEDVTNCGQTLNIGEGGFRIEGPHTDFSLMGVNKTDELYVHISVKFPSHEFAALCKPVYVHEKEAVDLPMEMSLSITDISSDNKQLLLDVLEIAQKLTIPAAV